MKTRTTITLTPEIYHKAKRLARERNVTISELIESLLATEKEEVSTDVVGSMLGMAELRESEPGADPLFDHLKEMYLR